MGGEGERTKEEGSEGEGEMKESVCVYLKQSANENVITATRVYTCTRKQVDVGSR
jgi:hypothetical protein